MNSDKVRGLVLASLFCVLVAIGAIIRIPLPLVPFTLQTFFVLLSGFMLGPEWGAISMGIYLVMGLVGVPVFSGGGGIQYIAHPTFGFVVSFIPAAWIAGWIVRIGPRSYYTFVISGIISLLLVYAIGISGLFLNLKYIGKTHVTFVEVLKFGVFPFIPGAIIKIAASSFLAWKVTRRLFSTGNVKEGNCQYKKDD